MVSCKRRLGSCSGGGGQWIIHPWRPSFFLKSCQDQLLVRGWHFKLFYDKSSEAEFLTLLVPLGDLRRAACRVTGKRQFVRHCGGVMPLVSVRGPDFREHKSLLGESESPSSMKNAAVWRSTDDFSRVLDELLGGLRPKKVAHRVTT
jgi:hypothetical protein